MPKFLIILTYCFAIYIGAIVLGCILGEAAWRLRHRKPSESEDERYGQWG